MFPVAVVLVVLAAVVGSVTMVGAFAYLLRRLRDLDRQAGHLGSPDAVSLIRNLEDELAQTQTELHLLSERLDFTERLLQRPEEDGGE